MFDEPSKSSKLDKGNKLKEVIKEVNVFYEHKNR